MIMWKSIEKVAIENDNYDYFSASQKEALGAPPEDNWKLVVFDELGQADAIYIMAAWDFRTAVWGTLDHISPRNL